MKKAKLNLASLAQQLQEQEGKLSGGFALLIYANNVVVLGGTEANNCSGGNCVQGCGTNNIAGCGGTVNNVAGCGKTALAAY